MPKRKPTDIVNLKVRFTEAFRARLAAEAKKNDRSLNKEIVHRLAMTFGADGAALAADFEAHEKRMSQLLHDIVTKLVTEGKRS